MFAKIILIATVVAAATAQHGHSGHNHGQEHGHAFSSQSIVLHPGHETQHHHHEQQEVHHGHHEAQQGHQEAQQGHRQAQQGHHQAQQGHHEAQHGHNEHKQETHHHEHEEHDIDYYAYPKYEYAYKIVDHHTHDEKSQHEHRDGDAVKGVYSLHQPDGSIRIVEYHADKKTGFHANVKYEGHSKHIIPEHNHHH